MLLFKLFSIISFTFLVLLVVPKAERERERERERLCVLSLTTSLFCIPYKSEVEGLKAASPLLPYVTLDVFILLLRST